MASTATQFVDPFDRYFQESTSALGMSASTKPGDGTQLTGSSIWEKIATGLGLEPDHEAEYQRMVDAENRAYERASVMSARAFDEYMDSTAVQRRKADYEAAGMNPWLMLQNGGISAGSTASGVGDGGSARASTKKHDSKSIGKDIALVFLATAKLLSVI